MLKVDPVESRWEYICKSRSTFKGLSVCVCVMFERIFECIIVDQRLHRFVVEPLNLFSNEPLSNLLRYRFGSSIILASWPPVLGGWGWGWGGGDISRNKKKHKSEKLIRSSHSSISYETIQLQGNLKSGTSTSGICLVMFLQQHENLPWKRNLFSHTIRSFW